jgi:hypothetical protein
MVRIVNGEIIRDETGQRRAGPRPRGVVSDLKSTAESAKDNQRQQSGSQPPRAEEASSGGRPVHTPPLRQDTMQSLGSVPFLDNIAQQLGIGDKFFVIPAIPQLGLTETKVSYIYGIVVAVVSIIFGWKVLLIVGVVYFIHKSSNNAPPSRAP